MSRYVFLVNPEAGRGVTRRRWSALQAALASSGVAYDVVESEYLYELEQQARAWALEPVEGLVAVGGDGTVNATVNGLLQSVMGGGGFLPLGIVPTGTRNDFARMLGIPADPIAALERVLAGRSIRVDVGLVRIASRPGEERFFVNGLGLGLEAAIAEELARRRLLTGRPAFLLSLLYAARDFEPIRLTVTAEGISRMLHLTSLSVSNGVVQVGHLLLTPRAAINDGKFNLCLIRALRPRAAVPLMIRAMRARHVRDAAVSLKRAPQITIRSEEPFRLHLDGEPWHPKPCYELRIELLPEWLTLLV